MRMLLVMLMMLAPSCAPVNLTAGDAALCDATRTDRAAHAAALADEGSDRVVLTGQALIARIDAGCAG